MRVIYEREEVEMDAPGGLAVEAIQARLKNYLGLPPMATAWVNGVEVDSAHLAGPASTIEFRVKQGQKGVGRVWTAAEYCLLFGLSQGDFEQQIKQGLRTMKTTSGTVVTETAIDNFLNGGDGEFLAVIAKSLEKIASRFDPPQDQRTEQSNGAGEGFAAPMFQPKRKSPYMTSPEAANYLGISIKSLYGQVERGHIKPLRGPKKTNRFTEKMLDEYLRS